MSAAVYSRPAVSAGKVLSMLFNGGSRGLNRTQIKHPLAAFSHRRQLYQAYFRKE